MRVVDELTRHARVDHAVGEGDRVIAVPVVALVGTAIGLAAHVDLHERALELGLLRLLQQPFVVLGHHGDGAAVHRARARSSSRESLWSHHKEHLTLAVEAM